MDAIQFDQLPDLCIRKILALLSLRDLLKCRAVNRQLKSYADSMQITELVVDEQVRLGMCPHSFKTWFGTDRPIDFKNSISLNAFKSARKSLFKLNEQLKFLHLSTRDCDSAFGVFRNLKQLIHLEIYSIFGAPRAEKTKTLDLPNLKVFAIERWDLIILETPKLQALRCVRNKIQLKYPETIKRLECLNANYDLEDDFEDLAKLSNLEVLHVELFCDSSPQRILFMNNIRVSDFADLKELHIKYALGNFGNHREITYNQLRSSLLNILHEKIALQRDELKLCLNEVLLVGAEQLPPVEALIRQANDADNRIDIENGFNFMNYRHLLRNSYPEVTWVHFNRLTELDFEISEDFFERFPRIQKLTVNDVVDQEQLEWFLQNANALSALKLTETRLDQAFVDRLPKLSPRLTHLEFYESSDLVTNFQFLLKFEHLEVFETDRPLHSFDLAEAAFRQLDKLKRLRCRTNNVFVEIQRSSPLEDSYSLQFFRMVRQGGSIKTSETFDQNLSWTQVAAFYEQRRFGPINAPVKKMRIKQLK